MPTWPGTLPQTVGWPGYARRLQETRVRTNMDAGPAKVRARFRSGILEQDVPVVYFTKAQWLLLETFYITTLLQGTLVFDWTDPISGLPVNFRFTSPPQFGAMLGPDTISVTLNLEVVP